jgi:hypothetical protein
LVLDIDETALSNWDEETQDDFGYIVKDWNDWVDKSRRARSPGRYDFTKKPLRTEFPYFSSPDAASRDEKQPQTT